MHQNLCRLGPHPRPLPPWNSLQRSLDPLTDGFGGPLRGRKGVGRKRGKGKGEKKKRKREEGKKGRKGECALVVR